MLEVDNDTIKKALEENQEAIEVKSDVLEVRTKEDFEAYTNNLRSESKTIGEEIGRKELFKELGVYEEGSGAQKSIEQSVNLLKSWNQGNVEKAIKDSGAEPDKQVKVLQKDIDTLQNTIATIEGEREKIKSQFNDYKINDIVKSTILSAIPDTTILPKDDMVMILKSKIPTKVEDGKVIPIGSDGMPLKDPRTLNVLSYSDEVKKFFTDNPTYLKGASGGAGGDDSLGGVGSKQNLDEFIKEMSELGYAPNSENFNEIRKERIKSGTLAF